MAENRMLATLGMEPQIGSTHEMPLKDLVGQIAQSKAPWAQLAKAPQPAAAK